jgi:hypothetical protein
MRVRIHRYLHIRRPRLRRRTFSHRYMWKLFLRRCRERFFFKQLGKVSRHSKEQYGRLLARYSFHARWRTLRYEPGASRRELGISLQAFRARKPGRP